MGTPYLFTNFLHFYCNFSTLVWDIFPIVKICIQFLLLFNFLWANIKYAFHSLWIFSSCHLSIFFFFCAGVVHPKYTIFCEIIIWNINKSLQMYQKADKTALVIYNTVSRQSKEATRKKKKNRICFLWYLNCNMKKNKSC